jgi:hypothetical protein
VFIFFLQVPRHCQVFCHHHSKDQWADVQIDVTSCVFFGHSYHWIIILLVPIAREGEYPMHTDHAACNGIRFTNSICRSAFPSPSFTWKVQYKASSRDLIHYLLRLFVPPVSPQTGQRFLFKTNGAANEWGLFSWPLKSNDGGQHGSREEASQCQVMNCRKRSGFIVRVCGLWLLDGKLCLGAIDWTWCHPSLWQGP